MADDTRVRHALMQAVGSASVAMSIIDNGGDPHVALARVREALDRGLNGRSVVRLQTCGAGVHREWWADGNDLPCPWCRIAALEGAPASTAGAA